MCPTISYKLSLSMPVFDIESYVGRSRAVDMAAIAWADVSRYPVSPEMIRTLRYMQDVESPTIIYLRSLLAPRAVDDPDVATFLACWVYEETFHGLALARFLEAAGSPTGTRARPRGQETFAKRIEAAGPAMVSKAWADFCAVHMVWGAINELTTLTGYRRFAAVAGHPVLTDLLERIVLDESRHFFFYYRQAEIRLQRRAVAGGSLLGAGGQRRGGRPGGRVHRHLSLRRAGRAGGRAEGRRHDPAAARIRDRSAPRSVDGPSREEPGRETPWPRQPLSDLPSSERAANTVPIPRGPSRAPSAIRLRSSSAACTGVASACCRRCWRAVATGRRYSPAPPGTIC